MAIMKGQCPHRRRSAPAPCDLTWYGETTGAKIDSVSLIKRFGCFRRGDRSGGISAKVRP